MHSCWGKPDWEASSSYYSNLSSQSLWSLNVSTLATLIQGSSLRLFESSPPKSNKKSKQNDSTLYFNWTIIKYKDIALTSPITITNCFLKSPWDLMNPKYQPQWHQWPHYWWRWHLDMDPRAFTFGHQQAHGHLQSLWPSIAMLLLGTLGPGCYSVSSEKRDVTWEQTGHQSKNKKIYPMPHHGQTGWLTDRMF